MAVTQFGRVDVLFNNAGVIPVGSLSDLSVMSTEHLVDVNIKGVLYGIKAVLPVMHQQGSGILLQLVLMPAMLLHQNLQHMPVLNLPCGQSWTAYDKKKLVIIFELL